MSYRTYNQGPYLTYEEIDVLNALKDYEETGDEHDWVPNAVLYEAYRRHWLNKLEPAFEDEHTKLLNRMQFGAALARVYPELRRVRRITPEGRQVSGRAGLRGPGSLRMPDDPESRGAAKARAKRAEERRRRFQEIQRKIAERNNGQ